MSLEYASQKVAIQGSIYLNSIKNYIYLQPDGIRLSTRGAFPVFKYNRTNARFMGFDGTLKYSLSERWFYSNKIALISAKNTSVNDELINIPSNSFKNGFTYAGSSANDKMSYDVTLEAQTVSRQGNAPEVFLDFENQEPPSGIYDYKEAPDGYTLLNLHASADFEKLRVGFSIENLLNTSYRDYMNRFRYFSDDLGINYAIRLFYNF